MEERTLHISRTVSSPSMSHRLLPPAVCMTRLHLTWHIIVRVLSDTAIVLVEWVRGQSELFSSNEVYLDICFERLPIASYTSAWQLRFYITAS